MWLKTTVVSPLQGISPPTPQPFLFIFAHFLALPGWPTHMCTIPPARFGHKSSWAWHRKQKVRNSLSIFRQALYLRFGIWLMFPRRKKTARKPFFRRVQQGRCETLFNYSSVANLIKHGPSTIGTDYQRHQVEWKNCILFLLFWPQQRLMRHSSSLTFSPTSSLSVAGFSAPPSGTEKLQRATKLKITQAKILRNKGRAGNLWSSCPEEQHNTTTSHISQANAEGLRYCWPQKKSPFSSRTKQKPKKRKQTKDSLARWFIIDN